jgi:cytochrome P450
MKGPKYEFPNGNLQKKFLQARQSSVEWEAKYGPVYRIWMGTKPEVYVPLGHLPPQNSCAHTNWLEHRIITTPDDVRAFWHESTDHQKTYLGNLGWLVSQIMGEGIGLINGQKWKNLRKSIDSMFSHKAAVGYLQHFNISSLKQIERLYSISQANNPQNQNGQSEKYFIVNAAKVLQRYPFFTTAEIFFGELTTQDEEDLWKLSKVYMTAFTNVVRGGVHRHWLTKWLNTEGWKEVEEYNREWNAFLRNMIRKTAKTRPDTPLNELWSLVLKKHISENEVSTIWNMVRTLGARHCLHSVQVVHTIAESLFANLDIATHVLTSSTLLLADNAKVQSDLLAEFKREEGNLQAYLARKDTLLHYCLLEALRLQPVICKVFFTLIVELC